MLETVIAAGLLVVGLAVIGTQVQDADTSVRKMQLRIRSMMLAETQMAELDLGLIELDSIDEMQEGDFGPRYPDFGWRLTTDPTAVDGLFRLTVEVLYLLRDGAYQEDSFDHDAADVVYTVYAFRTSPQPLDLTLDFGMTESELTKFTEEVQSAGIPCFEGGTLDPTCLATRGIEEIIKTLPALDALGFDMSALEAYIPPDLLEAFKESGLLTGLGSETPTGEKGNP